MQPPATPWPARTPLAANTPGFGQVVAVAGISESIVNCEFAKWLVNVVGVDVESVHVPCSGGTVRFTSCCSTQLNGLPDWFTCLTLAFANPFTPSQPP